MNLAAVLISLLPLSIHPTGVDDTSNRIVLSNGQKVPFEQMITALASADVVFVGEQHDHKLGHELELEILKGVHAKNPSLALSLEMFERDVQGVVDEYLKDQINESNFLAASRPWPGYKTDYAPMVEFCKANKLPVIAANAPRRYVNMVTRKGQESLLELPKDARSNLAKLPYSTEVPEGYNKALDEVFGNHGTGGAPAPAGMQMPSPERMKLSQMLWDVTMADSILKGRARTHAKTVIQMNGAMHSDSGYGIADRVRRTSPRLNVVIVSIKTDSAYPNISADQYKGVADFVVVTGPDLKTAPEGVKF